MELAGSREFPGALLKILASIRGGELDVDWPPL
jgi:hypothetical protein